MAPATVLSLSALAALLPATLLPFLRQRGRDALFWAAAALALTAVVAWLVLQLGAVWNAGFAASLWLSIAAILVVFLGLAAGTRSVWRLSPVLFPYLFGLGVLATVWSAAPAHEPIVTANGSAWLAAHIAVALAAYALLSLAAVAAVAVTLQEHALKSRRPTDLTRLLPSVSEAEALQLRLLLAGEIVLGAGLLSGMAVGYLTGAPLLRADHKTVLVVASFVVVGALLLVHGRSGLRGRAAARGALVACLLLTLGYPGVKFVGDVLLG